MKENVIVWLLLFGRFRVKLRGSRHILRLIITIFSVLPGETKQKSDRRVARVSKASCLEYDTRLLSPKNPIFAFLSNGKKLTFPYALSTGDTSLKENVKAVPLQAGSRRLRLPGFETIGI